MEKRNKKVGRYDSKIPSVQKEGRLRNKVLM